LPKIPKKAINEGETIGPGRQADDISFYMIRETASDLAVQPQRS
jgi:hypothetical protein